MAERLLDIKGLKTHFFTDEGVVRAVDGVDLYIDKGETLGVVGESGCGKSVTALSIMRLIPQPPGRIVEGRILYNGRSLLDLSAADMRRIRGKEIAMIFQEPMTSLNPVFTVGEQIAEAIRLHEGLGRRDAMDKTIEMLRVVHISNPERRGKEEAPLPFPPPVPLPQAPALRKPPPPQKGPARPKGGLVSSRGAPPCPSRSCA